MAEMLKFRKGTHAKLLQQTKAAGTIYVTTDEKAMYVDIDDNTRIRLGQTVNFATLAEFKTFLNSTIPPYSTEAFYYIEDSNALLKWVSNNDSTDIGNGENNNIIGTWKQINSTKDLSNAITGLEGVISELTGNFDKLEERVVDLEGTVFGNEDKEGLVETVGKQGNSIDNLNKAIITGDNATKGTIGHKVTIIESNLNDLKQTVGESETQGLKGRIKEIENIVSTLDGEIDEVGSVKYQINEVREDLVEKINSDIKAANAMEYIDGVSNSSTLPTSAKNGATYVAEGAFTLNGEQVYPGDLLIATGTENASTGLITNPTWTVVHTGYDASLEQTLKTVNGKIQLTSAVGNANNGQISFVAKSGSSTTVSVANNTVTIGLEWDNF